MMLLAVCSIDVWASCPDFARPAREARENALSSSSSDSGVVGSPSNGWLIGGDTPRERKNPP